MNWLRMHQRTAWICGLTLLVPLLLLFYLMALFYGSYSESQEEISRIEPRLARLQGLIDHESELRAAAEVVDSQVLELVYPATEDQAAVAAELQTQVRDIFSNAGLAINNSQVLPVREQGNFDYIALKLTTKGSLAALDNALAELATFLPLVLVESIDVYPARAVRGRESTGVQELTANVQLLSLRAAL
ncbi:MAG: type II secretion system protein GspM [Pseudomonadota bacterium]